MSQKTRVISFRVTEEEYELAEKLANYLHKIGKIDAPNIGDAMRVCLYFTVNEILKAIEAERYASR
jgi:hypothetical protein